jgi:hypothetical protein
MGEAWQRPDEDGFHDLDHGDDHLLRGFKGNNTDLIIDWRLNDPCESIVLTEHMIKRRTSIIRMGLENFIVRTDKGAAIAV